MNSLEHDAATAAVAASQPLARPLSADLAGRLASLDRVDLRRRFLEDDEFLAIPDFLPPSVVAALQDAVRDTRGDVHRNFIPGHKKGGSVSRHVIDRKARAITALYENPELRRWLCELCGQALLPSPDNDPHAYALYFYTEAGDHIGWHYDSSYYQGRRYTLLLGVVDDSSCRLEYRLHTKSARREASDGSISLAPGAFVFFNGDRLQHRITPAAAGHDRVALTFEFVTSQAMHPWWRFFSNLKDAFAYFGIRQVFTRGGPSA